jgi:hypothetical protein
MPRIARIKVSGFILSLMESVSLPNWSMERQLCIIIRQRYKAFFEGEEDAKDRELTDDQVQRFREKWEDLPAIQASLSDSQREAAKSHQGVGWRVFSEESLRDDPVDTSIVPDRIPDQR